MSRMRRRVSAESDAGGLPRRGFTAALDFATESSMSETRRDENSDRSIIFLMLPERAAGLPPRPQARPRSRSSVRHPARSRRGRYHTRDGCRCVREVTDARRAEFTDVPVLAHPPHDAMSESRVRYRADCRRQPLSSRCRSWRSQTIATSVRYPASSNTRRATCRRIRAATRPCQERGITRGQ